jgi:hypothetical protein
MRDTVPFMDPIPTPLPSPENKLRIVGSAIAGKGVYDANRSLICG